MQIWFTSQKLIQKQNSYRHQQYMAQNDFYVNDFYLLSWCRKAQENVPILSKKFYINKNFKRTIRKPEYLNVLLI